MKNEIEYRIQKAQEKRLKVMDELLGVVLTLKRLIRRNRVTYSSLKQAEELLNVLFSQEEVIDVLTLLKHKEES